MSLITNEQKLLELQKEIDKQKIILRLSEIDTLKIRPLTNIILNSATNYDNEKLITLETEAEKLRTEYRKLEEVKK